MVSIDESKFGGWIPMLVFGLMCLIIGLVALLWTKMSIQVYITLMGIIAIVTGVLTLINANNSLDKKYDLIVSIMTIALGAVLVIVPFFVASIMAYLFAAFFIIFGLGGVFGIAYTDPEHKKYSVVAGIVMIVIGIIIAIFPNETVIVTTWVSGLILAVVGVLCIIGAWGLKKTIDV